MNAILVKMQGEGLLDEQAARDVEALVSQGKSLDEALLTADDVPEERLLRFLSEEFHVPYVDLDIRPPTREFLGQFPARVLLRHQLLPLSKEDEVVVVAPSKLFDTSGLDELSMACGHWS